MAGNMGANNLNQANAAAQASQHNGEVNRYRPLGFSELMDDEEEEEDDDDDDDDDEDDDSDEEQESQDDDDDD